MVDTLKALAGSKKFLSAVAGILALVGIRFLGLPEDQAASLSLQVTGVISALLLGQGAADMGKSKALVEKDGAMEVLGAFPELGEDLEG